MVDTGEVVGRRRRSQAEAEGPVWDFEQSGLTRKAFREARYRCSYVGLLPASGPQPPTATQAGELLPVELMDGTPPGSGLRVELANGGRTVVEAGFDVLHLKRLLAVLEG
jgi:hypothetical protein